MNQKDGQSCPGAERCREEKTPGNLWKYTDEQEDDVCKGCHLFSTKPENIPEGLAEHAADAAELAELQESGATFAYPTALSPTEWAALSGLTRGRKQAERLDRERTKKGSKRSKTK